MATWTNLTAGLIKYPPPIHVHCKGTHEENREEHPVNKNTGANLNIRGTEGEIEIRSNQVFTKIIYPQQRISTNLTGWLPVTFQQGKKYFLVL